jgi:hypothetical protein
MIPLSENTFGKRSICSEKFFWWHRLPACADRLAGGDARPTEPFHYLWVGHRPMRNCLEKFGSTGILPVRGTGWKPVLPKAAGAEARPTGLFIIYR